MSAEVAPPLPRDAAPDEVVVGVRDLAMHFPIREGVLQRVSSHVRAVDGVTFDIGRGETVGLVGESGCGKTTLGRCISGLLAPTAGGIYFDMSRTGVERLDSLLGIRAGARTQDESQELAAITTRHRIDAMASADRRRYRRNCQVVFQDAFASLNPRHLVVDIVGRPLRIHGEASGSALIERVVDLLDQVGLGRQHLYRYPHQFSGGQRQRISIARALALSPTFIVLDEPTSALDVSVQAQILNLLHRLQQEHGLTYLFVSHDLNVVRHMSDRIIVMYLGRICEVGSANDLFEHPRHPYTEALVAANPGLEKGRATIRLRGAIPDPSRPPQGCRFHTRCPVVTERCGWAVDDVLRYLDEQGPASEGLADVQRRSPFDADLVFGTGDEAETVAADLSSEYTSPAMRGALVELRADGKVVRVRFEPIDEVELEEIGPGHATACILHTGGSEGPTGS